MRDRVVVPVDLDVVVDVYADGLPLGEDVGSVEAGAAARAGRAARTGTAAIPGASGRPRVEPLEELGDGGVRPASEKVRWRSAASTQRSTIWTAASVLALSRGRRTRAGSRRRRRQAVVLHCGLLRGFHHGTGRPEAGVP